MLGVPSGRVPENNNEKIGKVKLRYCGTKQVRGDKVGSQPEEDHKFFCGNLSSFLIVLFYLAVSRGFYL
jgi:hypothetical protein